MPSKTIHPLKRLMLDGTEFTNSKDADHPVKWIGDFSERFALVLPTDLDGNYAIDKFIEKNKLLTPGGSSDPEFSCTYVYFSDWNDAELFVEMWNTAMRKLVNDLMSET